MALDGINKIIRQWLTKQVEKEKEDESTWEKSKLREADMMGVGNDVIDKTITPEDGEERAILGWESSGQYAFFFVVMVIIILIAQQASAGVSLLFLQNNGSCCDGKVLNGFPKRLEGSNKFSPLSHKGSKFL